MSSLSRKQRKTEKEKNSKISNTGDAQERKTSVKGKKKIYICNHYATVGDTEESFLVKNLLNPVSDSECICKICQKRFSINDYRTMEEWVSRCKIESMTKASDSKDVNRTKLPPLILVSSPIIPSFRVSSPPHIAATYVEEIQAKLKPVKFSYTTKNEIVYEDTEIIK